MVEISKALVVAAILVAKTIEEEGSEDVVAATAIETLCNVRYAINQVMMLAIATTDTLKTLMVSILLMVLLPPLEILASVNQMCGLNLDLGLQVLQL